MSTLTNPSVAPLLKRLLAEAAENDAEILPKFHAGDATRRQIDDRQHAEELSNAWSRACQRARSSSPMT
jgi:hypothetical protein